MRISSIAKRGLAVATFAAMAAMSGGAYAAAQVNALFVGGALNEIEDTDADRIFDAAGALKTSGQFAVGDRIESLLRFNDVNGAAISDSIPAPYKLIAYATLTISAITDLGGGSCDLGDACIARTTPLVEVYETDTIASNFLSLDPDAQIAAVQAETLVLTLGLVEADDFWAFTFTRTADTIGTIAAATGSTDPQAGLYQFGVSATSNPGAIPFAANGIVGADGNLHDFAGNGSGYGKSPGVNAGWLLSTNTLVQFRAVPEPGTLGLLGLALAGAGWVGRRRQK